MDSYKAAQKFGLSEEILSDASAAIIAIDHNERVTYLNPIAEQRYACSASHAIGLPLRDLYSYEWIAPNDAANAYTALADVGIWQGRNIHVLRDGTRMTVDSVVRVVNRYDTPPGMVAVIRAVALL